MATYARTSVQSSGPIRTSRAKRAVQGDRDTNRSQSATERKLRRAGTMMVGGGLAAGAAGMLVSATGIGVPVGVVAMVGGAASAIAGSLLLFGSGPISKGWDALSGGKKRR